MVLYFCLHAETDGVHAHHTQTNRCHFSGAVGHRLAAIAYIPQQQALAKTKSAP
jgi:hypothetical protein